MGDPACWSHLFYEDENDNESPDMKTSNKKAKATSAIAPDLEDFFRQNDPRIHAELFEFLRIPSVSAKSEHNADTRRAAEWVKNSLDKIGVPARIYPTAGHPVVVGEWRNAPGAPTVLIYGHYDVQPAEPLELWTSPPFEPTVRNGNIFARGSVDDKGQVFLHIKALEAHLAARGRLPVNVVVIVEGEEEIGSEHLASFVKEQKKLLKADAVVISDSAMFAPGLPSILSSLRGLAYF
ncbi:MAG: peptidase, partial [Gemmatimonadales bacterium]|nr:peptidase [Gemmatimonadales bacterium]